MQTSESNNFCEDVNEPRASTDEVVSLAKNSEFDNNIFAEFNILFDKFTPVLVEFKENDKIMDRPPVSKAVESLKKELK